MATGLEPITNEAMFAALNHFQFVDYAIFALYLVASVLVGVLFVKESKDLKGYFLAGQSMGYIVVGISVLAALFSGISYLASPSEIYTHGITFFFVSLSFFIATPITTVIFLPFFYRSRFYTAYQYLEERFSVQVRLLGSALFILRVLVWLALAVYAPSLALEQVTGLPLWFSILCTGILTTIYTTLGGMKAVIWTDVMQFFVLIGGQIAILYIAVAKVPGGWGQVFQIAQDTRRFDVDFSLNLTTRMTFWGAMIGGAFVGLVQMATDQVSVQRYLTATSLKEARRSLWFKLVLLLPTLMVFYLTGLVLYAFYQVQGDPLAAGKIAKGDQILPYFVVNELPRGMPGLLVAAIFAASMSTVSAGISSLTSTTIIDFHQRLWKKSPRASADKQVRLAKVLTLIYGMVVMLLAFQVEKLGSLVEASNKIIGLVGGPLLGLFILGMLFQRANVPGVLIGWFAGLVVMIKVGYFSPISWLWYPVIGFAVTVAVGWLASLAFPKPSPEKLESLTWQSRYAEAKAAESASAAARKSDEAAKPAEPTAT
jgi:SSS family transporter